MAKLTSPDLLIVDIRMPEREGLDVVQAFTSIPTATQPQLLVVTASERHAIEAFEIGAIDYVLKPYSVDRLRSAVGRIREQQGGERVGFEGVNGNDAVDSDANGQSSSGQYLKRLVYRSRGRILFLPVNEIRWIEAQENYVRICTGAETHLVRQAIGHFENQLDPHSFLRVHRSAIVNLHCIREIKNAPGGDGTVILKSGEEIAMSRSYRARFQRLLKS